MDHCDTVSCLAAAVNKQMEEGSMDVTSFIWNVLWTPYETLV